MTSPVWSSRRLRSQVTVLLQSFSRCQHCIRRHSVSPADLDSAQFLSTQLEPEDYQAVLSNPKYFVREAESPGKGRGRSCFSGKMQRGKSVPNQPISPVFHSQESTLKPKSAQKRPGTSVQVRERRLIAARAFIRRITLPALDKSAGNIDLRSRNVQKLWKSLANTSFKEAILTKNPPPSAVFLSKIEDKRDKRQEKIDKNTAFLHELTLKRQQGVSRKKEELEFQQLLQRKRLELRLEQRKGRKVGN